MNDAGNKPHERMLRCLGMAGLTPAERNVLAVIASFDGPGGAYPSHARIASVLNQSERVVRRLIASARDKRALTTIKRQRTSRYQIDYEFRPDQFRPVSPNIQTGRKRDSDWPKLVPQTGPVSATELEENWKPNLGEAFQCPNFGSASAREPSACPGGPPSRAHGDGGGTESKGDTVLALPSPERFAKQQVFDAYRAAHADRQKAKAEAHSARMLVEADAQWSSAIAKAAAPPTKTCC